MKMSSLPRVRRTRISDSKFFTSPSSMRFMVEMETPLLSASSACDMSCFRRTVFILAAILLQSSVSVSMYMFSNISNLVLVAVNIGIKVHKWNFIGDNLGGGQFICRETCCFVHLARKNILQAKEKWLRPFSWRSHLIPYFDLVCLGMKLCEFILVLQK